ncbi:trimeric intracellular cation channel family protein [Niabella ginsengisoli]|uniref:TRIC cation channel family protein n=1 Tax=Niabella ginsengisoli TaxID=522298 RepID=A0ABS9SQE0_9BACT|nr:TRIC cation channel family protein [Niabella ginsengisoli]MCH5600334.1 TRIC cation channel family protein [Niabella ginsengisoli]
MTFLKIITYLGIFVFALAGAFKARGAKLDVFGGLVVAFVSAYGGGTLRDLLLGVKPVNWINDNLAFALVFAGTAVTFLVKDKVNNFRRTIFFTDAIGLGLFTAAGIEIALRNGTNEIYGLVMGVITATFGGLIADIFCGYPPLLLRKGELYATACAAGGIFSFSSINTLALPKILT